MNILFIFAMFLYISYFFTFFFSRHFGVGKWDDASSKLERAVVSALMDGVKSLFTPLSALIASARAIITSQNGFIDFSHTAAGEAYASNAPPTAPPVDNRFNLLQALQSLLPSYFEESQYAEILKKPAVSAYVSAKIIQHFRRYPHFLPRNINTLANYTKFQTAIKGEINRKIKDLLAFDVGRTFKGRQSDLIYAARQAFQTHEISIDADFPNDGGDKPTNFHDVVGDNSGEPLSLLLAKEQDALEAATLAGLTSEDKVRLLNEYDALKRWETGELFDFEPVSDEGEGGAL